MKRLPLVRSLTNAFESAGGVPPVAERGTLRPRDARFGLGRRDHAETFAGWRHWAVVLLLVTMPVVVYGPSIMARYGMRDDYSVLREAHEEPDKVLRVCAMQARPLHGVLLAESFRRIAGVDDLWRLRALCALLFGAVGAVLYVMLRRWHWDRWTALPAAALITLVPSAQIGVGWAVAWPLPLAMLLGAAAFGCAERAFATATRDASRRPSAPAAGRRISMGWWLAAVVAVAAAALIYQPDSLFYFAAMAAALWSHRRWGTRHGIEWLARHVATVVIGLGLAFTLMIVAFAHGWVPVSPRVGFEHDWLGKLAWFVRVPLKHAVALVVLDDDAGVQAVRRVAAIVGIAIGCGLVGGVARRRLGRGVWWLGSFVVVIVGSYAVNLLVADRWPAYRVLMPLSATVVVVLATALRSLGGRWLARIGLGALVLPGIWLARQQTISLIAEPQAIEFEQLAAGAARIDPAQRPAVFVLTPTPSQHVAARVYRDEFGSLSTDSDWVPKEMLKLVMKERFPELPDVNSRYTVTCGRQLPAGRRFDVVIDLRHMPKLGP